MIKRIQIYGLLAVVLGCLVVKCWPKEERVLPDFRIVQLGAGDHGDLTFTNPTFVVLNAHTAKFGTVRFKNQGGYGYPGAITLRGTNTVYLEFQTLAVSGGRFALYARVGLNMTAAVVDLR